MTPGAEGPEALVGREIAGYRLDRVLGMGMTGAVFLGQRVADDPTKPHEVAVKILLLPWQMTADERATFRNRFMREAETLRGMHHPNIVSILDAGEQDGLTYMVLPYLSGGTLATRLAAGRSSLEDANRWATELASALDYAHGLGVVHRDIKPQNVLLDNEGVAHIADFSIARLLDETRTKLTSTSRLMGTPAYMAPEQIATGRADAASDLYSLAAVVFEMVTGRIPFEADTLPELFSRIGQDAPSLPRSLRPELPEPAEAAIWQALSKQPGERFPSATAFARALSTGLGGTWDPSVRPIVFPTDPASHPGSMQWTNTTIPPAVWAAQHPAPRRRSTAPIWLALIALLLVGALVLNRSGIGVPWDVSHGLGGAGTPTTGSIASGGKTPTTSGKKTTKTPTPHSNTNPGVQPTYPPGAPPPTVAPYPTYTPYPTPTPLPTATPTPIILSGNLAPQASRSAGSGAVVDGSLSTEWIGGHGSASSITFSWPVAVTIHQVIVWDRSQSSSDNNQINLVGVSFSDGSGNANIDMVSGGPRCAVINFSNKSVTWVTVYPNDASGNNGYKEIEIWATTGPQSSGNYCSNTRYI